MWFLLCTPVELGLLFLSLYRAEVVENGSQTPQEHRKETQGDWEGHLTTPVTLYVHEQLPLQSGQIAKAFQEQLAAKTRSGRNTGLEVRENREQILHCSLPPWFVAPWHYPPPQRQSLGQGHTTELLAWGKSPCWRLQQEGQSLPISQYSMLQRTVAKFGRLTVSFARALAPFQAILSGLIVW